MVDYLADSFPSGPDADTWLSGSDCWEATDPKYKVQYTGTAPCLTTGARAATPRRTVRGTLQVVLVRHQTNCATEAAPTLSLPPGIGWPLSPNCEIRHRDRK